MSNALKTSTIVGIIGAGAMGVGIAQVAALAGHQVALFDIDAATVAKAITGIAANLARLVEKGRLDATAAAHAQERLIAVHQLAELRDAQLVIEAVAERLDVKRKIFAELEEHVAKTCILATNTSSISVTAIGATLKIPSRLVGMHFFNPAPVMALVEVVSGLATSADVAKAVYETAAAWGKTPVYARSTPGFIVNRVARPFYAEGLRLLNEQAADVASIDEVMREAGGFRMGPFELMDLIGHDVNFAVTESVFRAYFNDPRFAPSLIQQELVNAGFLGRKSGRGFYEYGPNATRQSARIAPPTDAPREVRLFPQSGVIMRLQQRLLNADLVTTAMPEMERTDGAVAQIDDAVLRLTDGRTATQCAYDMEHDNVVLVDLALDYAGSSTVALARARQCSDSAYAAVVGAMQAAGYSVVPVADVAGMIVMRTVAMLVNEAADAVNQGVCTAADLDLAMEKGVNYPVGPLKWADEAGVTLFNTVLKNLCAHYGEDRYRVSPLLAALSWSRASWHAHDAVDRAA
ncbi:3-hydroxybutyryl-CoA dehydrogenase [Paraburkholderia ribeironis]|uniref:3-hydroxybutyryl-CoA dehydrogenase n=1 Tax=Paraburkholderia ribeironis TaxID=1247936 RepID=A0A1N7S7V6_9BURK|nr:3-hydroxyacyl-CoA dehydrogenase PaaH [Paraburkholderia ribeironis]SIT43449.1 3-hydroxybutyryl-CoA dehydrogenase [Paraburkholderia ribeironis]